MNDIAELERRIAAALERIEIGIDQLAAGAPAVAAPFSEVPVPEAADGEEVARLTALLDEEKSVNAQLTERVRAIRDKQETMVGGLERKVAELSEQIEAAVLELKRIKEANAELTEANRALTEASQDGVMEPHLINRSMMVELEALRAARAAEMAEMDEILTELRPLIGEVA